MFSIEEILVMVFGLLIRAMTSVHPHSGQGVPPMFGDYEAQRHWQEITVNLPIQDWYQNTTDNDLMYWGLDYPPLTAYHSWIVGKVAQFYDPSFVELQTSRGTENYEHKIFMRNSVLIVDVLLYIPAVLFFCRSLFISESQKQVLLAAILLYPGQILIDNGHFQYNNISLGLFVLAVAFILRDRNFLASMAFVLALSYKQMELYHALPFFFYLLGLCLRKEPNWLSAFVNLAKIGLVVIATFGLIWWPFFPQIEQVLTRIFPLNRGLFEDKVANFWCALNVLFKIKTLYTSDFLALTSAVTTLALSLPSNLALFWRPTKSQFLCSLLNTSLVFFLFSYQVHEKSILLVAIPAFMMLTVNQGRFSRLVTTWFLLTTTFSMWPLLKKDGLYLAFLALQVIFATFCHYCGFFEFGEIVTATNNKKIRASPKPMSNTDLMKTTCYDWLIWTLFNFSLVGFVAIISASVYVEPPAKLPDLWTLMISVYSAGHFLGFLLYFLNCQYQLYFQQTNQDFVTGSEKKNK